MKSNDIKALHEMNIDELKKKLNELEKQLHESWIQLANRKLTNTSSVKELKYDIARVKTVISELELTQASTQDQQ